MSFKERALRLGEIAWRSMPVGARFSVLRVTNETWLFGVVGLVTNAKGEVLVLEHRYRVPWRWGLPGGHVVKGEALEAALHREVMEETGLAIRAEPRIIDFELAANVGAVTVTLSAVSDGGIISPRSFEIVSGAFFRPDSLPESMDRYQRAIVDRWVRGQSSEGLPIGSRTAKTNDAR
ncbi:MAG: NUDIX hydrolase [Deltaproteobacteria bacterium]|nr:NUDIX hydrolase [Deltaproteobacteria bacterium]